MEWIKFFQHHRKLGYNVILISQNDKLIDKQMRSFIEYDVKHRKANNYGAIGMIFTILQLKLFVAVEYWYGVREKCGVSFFTYRKIYSKLYDSYKMFDQELITDAADREGGARLREGTNRAAACG
jgi:zona occludens toxin (predicted ATPase)